MNERMQELIEQAGYIYDGGLVVPNMEKFAELIVRGCITNIEQYRLQNEDDRETEYDDGYLDGMGRAERILKEHFGVE